LKTTDFGLDTGSGLEIPLSLLHNRYQKIRIEN